MHYLDDPVDVMPGAKITAVGQPQADDCAHYYPGIRSQCPEYADVVVRYEGSKVGGGQQVVAYCRDHVRLPDRVWDVVGVAVTDGGAKQMTITDEFVQNHAVPLDDVVTFVHIGLDDAYHPAGGYWVPTNLEPNGETTGWVQRRSQLPKGEVVQYPLDDRPPEVRGTDDLPDWVQDRVIDGDGGQTDG